MKRIVLLGVISLLFCTISVGTFAQDKKMTRKEKEAAWRAERLRKRAAEERRVFESDSIQFIQAIEAIKRGSWALEASNLTFGNGITNLVTESTNFVSVNNGTATVQTALNNTNVYSPNGLGGITLEGNVGSERMIMDQYGDVHYSFNIFGGDISATVNIIITAGSNEATARIDPNFSTNDLIMGGCIYPYSSAGIIEGTPGY